jgi:uncharacterized protein GlcG (DUF336 family)
MTRARLAKFSLAAVLAPLPSLAQPVASAPVAASLPAVSARDPLSLPGDILPSGIAVVLAPPAPPSAAPPPPPRPVVPGPSLTVALVAAQAALKRCETDGLKVGVAVSDSLGVVVVGLQMDGANPGRIFNAARKNLAAIEFGMPTSAVRERLRAGEFATLARVKPSMTLFPGAVPLIVDGKVIGAIGISGATAGQDEVCAAAGAAAIVGRL